jgi:polysaccharide deacetylase 2 family uncharacterized protein YibQ
LTNPYVGAGGAAMLMLASALTLVLVTGNPHAGAPSVRLSLDTPSKSDGGKPVLRADLPPSPTLGIDAVPLDSLKPGEELTMTASPPPVPIEGEAVITLPQGATVGAGAANASPVAGVLAPLQPAARPKGPPLPPAPIAGLSAPGPGGPLPVIARDGRTPFQAYAHPFRSNGKPKVALIIGGLGLNAAATKAAIERLPPEVTLSFVPYADNLQGWIDLARADGHEVLLEIPMEPLDYPNNDPGPYTLMGNARPADTVKRLEWLLARASGYFGVSNYMGGRFLSSDTGMAAFGAALRSRGLAFIDDGTAARRGGAYARGSADAIVDQQLTADGIEKQLLGLEAKALQHGSALGTGFSYAVTVERVIRWSQGLANRGYQLAPASAIAHR